MYLAEITVQLPERDITEEFLDELDELFTVLLISWRDNGQILEADGPVVKSPAKWVTQVQFVEPSSLEAFHGSERVNAAREKLAQLEINTPIVKIIGKIDGAPEYCMCDNRHSYILCTDYCTYAGPLRCGNCFGLVPLYEIPPTDQVNHTYQDIAHWKMFYEACDRLYVQSDVLEKPALHELTRPDSRLSKLGREICAQIRENTAKPAYYPLYHSEARSHKSEERRKCPSCEGEWRLTEKWHDLFDFKCDRCSLVAITI